MIVHEVDFICDIFVAFIGCILSIMCASSFQELQFIVICFVSAIYAGYLSLIITGIVQIAHMIYAFIAVKIFVKHQDII